MVSPYRAGEDTTPYQLGTLRSAHAERSGCLVWLIVGALGAYIAVAAFFLGVSASTALQMLVVISIGVGALWWIKKRNPRRLVQLYERGITSEKHGRPRVIRFDDVRSITSGKQRRGLAGVETQHHIVEAKDGSRIAFNLLFDGALDLLAAIDEATRQRLQDEALEAFDAGEILRFGPIAMSEEGFFDRDRPVTSWNEIERAAIEMPALAPGLVWSEVKIWKRGSDEPTAKHPLDQVPNANVMLAVLSLAVDDAGDESTDE
ncbi:MAG: DUF6585 family protein [Polyangiaceae bacterium]